MPTALRWVTLLFVVLGITSVAPARDVFVDNEAGNDRFLGTAQQPLADRSGPVKTIRRALEIAGAGDRVVLAKTGQPYRECVSLVGSRHSGTERHPFVIEGNGAILEGADAVAEKRWEHCYDTVFRFRPRHLVYQQLFINDRPAPRIMCSRPMTAPPELDSLEWCLFDGHIYFRAEPYKRPENYALTVATRQTGITLFHVDHVTISNLTVQGFQLDAINAHNSARHVILQNVTCRGNGRAGVAVGGASQLSVESSLLGNNGEAQLLTNPYSETYVIKSRLLSNTAPGWIDRGGRVRIDGEVVEGGLDEMPPAETEPAPAEG